MYDVKAVIVVSVDSIVLKIEIVYKKLAEMSDIRILDDVKIVQQLSGTGRMVCRIKDIQKLGIEDAKFFDIGYFRNKIKDSYADGFDKLYVYYAD